MMFNHPLRSLLVDVECINTWSMTQWDSLLQQGYASGMMASIYAALSTSEKLDHIPAQMYWHLAAANTAYESHKDACLKEVKHIIEALSLTDVSPVFLKGTAYLLANDNAHYGRVFNDVDIFVAKTALPAVEQFLAWQGWSIVDKDDYDQAYYRQWMHELPPLTHQSRGTTLDVHHNLLPVIGRVKLDAHKLLDNASSIEGMNCQVLSPEDRVLHSASHLFLNGEFDSGFRDLYDLDQLLRQHTQNNSEFCTVLSERAKELGLDSVLRDCFRYTKYIFNTPIPDNAIALMNADRHWQCIRAIRDGLFIRALQPRHDCCTDRWTPISLFILFLRGHWLKMPLHILLYHSVKKSWKGLGKIVFAKKTDRPILP
jgi:hypothetical protein